MLLTSGDVHVRSTHQPDPREHAQPDAHARRCPRAAGHAEGGRGARARSSGPLRDRGRQGRGRYSLGLSRSAACARRSPRCPTATTAARSSFDDDGIVDRAGHAQASRSASAAPRPRSISRAPTRSRSAPMTTGWEEAARAIVGPKVVLDPRHPMNAGAMRPVPGAAAAGSMVLGAAADLAVQPRRDGHQDRAADDQRDVRGVPAARRRRRQRHLRARSSSSASTRVRASRVNRSAARSCSARRGAARRSPTA